MTEKKLYPNRGSTNWSMSHRTPSQVHLSTSRHTRTHIHMFIITWSQVPRHVVHVSGNWHSAPDIYKLTQAIFSIPIPKFSINLFFFLYFFSFIPVFLFKHTFYLFFFFYYFIFLSFSELYFDSTVFFFSLPPYFFFVFLSLLPFPHRWRIKPLRKSISN